MRIGGLLLVTWTRSLTTARESRFRGVDAFVHALRMSDPSATTGLDRGGIDARLTAARDALSSLRPRVIDAGPWPLAEDFGTGPEASWGPPEILAHLAEMLPFWQGELERVVEAARGPGDGMPFGRVAEDAMRIGILERDRSLPVRELFDRIDAGIARWRTRVAGLTNEQAAARGLHPRQGEVPAVWILDRFVLQHLDEHIEQLNGLLPAA
jgi:hypothetical protein